MNTVTILIEMTVDEYETALSWAKAYGIRVDELLNYLVNRLEIRREEKKAEKARERDADRGFK